MRKLQRQKYFIETGTYNLIHIIDKMSEKKPGEQSISKKTDQLFTLVTIVTIRKATQFRERPLLDAFVANGLIDEVVKILTRYGAALFHEIEHKKNRTDEEQ